LCLVEHLLPCLQAAKFSGLLCGTGDQWFCVTTVRLNRVAMLKVVVMLFIDALIITNLIVLPRSASMQLHLVPA
jgi:hypothetical protein